MNKALTILVFILTAMPFSFLASQEKRKELSYDFDLAIDSVGWQTGENPSRLFEMPIYVAGRAYAAYQYERGNTLQYNKASNRNDYRLYGESYYRLSPDAMLYGCASFSMGQEQDVVGSAFYNPSAMPFDITFMDEANLANRKFEHYQILGALGYRLSKHFALGTKFDYHAINMARTKDLRHTNKVLAMNVTAGISYFVAKHFSLSAHYRYNRYIESVNFNIYGTTDQQYFSLINYGAFSGVQELFDSNGYTTKGSNTPFVENIHHAGFQLEFKPTDTFSVFSETVWGSLNGYYGKKGTSNVLFTHHSGYTLSEQLRINYTHGHAFHSLHFNAHIRKIDNYENLWRTETGTNGNSIIKYYGENLVGKKNLTTLYAEYSLSFGNFNNAPLWTFKLGSGMDIRNITAMVYPHYRKQKLKQFQYNANAIHQFNFRQINFMIDLHLAYKSGRGNKAFDGSFSANSQGGTMRYQNEFLNREYDYLTSNRFVAGATVRVAMPIGKLQSFVEVHYDSETMLSSANINNQQNLSFRLGVNF